MGENWPKFIISKQSAWFFFKPVKCSLLAVDTNLKKKQCLLRICGIIGDIWLNTVNAWAQGALHIGTIPSGTLSFAICKSLANEAKQFIGYWEDENKCGSVWLATHTCSVLAKHVKCYIRECHDILGRGRFQASPMHPEFCQFFAAKMWPLWALEAEIFACLSGGNINTVFFIHSWTYLGLGIYRWIGDGVF